MLPIELPLTPMLAKMVGSLPRGPRTSRAWAYEPKWDGWRCLLARDGEHVRLWSRRGTELTAYFPELVAAALAYLPECCVLDGEIVIIAGDHLDYTRLSSRFGSVARAEAMARAMPATYVAFDVLAMGDASVMEAPWTSRRELLEAIGESMSAPLLLSPKTTDHEVAMDWFDRFEGAGLDGVVAKSTSGTYQPGQRVMLKMKHRRTADVVVAGFRLDRTSTRTHPNLGSLLLGLFDGNQTLQFVGICAGFPGPMRPQLATMLGELELDRGSVAYAEHPWSAAQVAKTGARTPEGVTRWSQPRDEAHLIEPLLACEVEFDYLHDQVRFRSNADFRRWRPDRDPLSCRFDQLEAVARYDLDGLFGG